MKINRSLNSALIAFTVTSLAATACNRGVDPNSPYAADYDCQAGGPCPGDRTYTGPSPAEQAVRPCLGSEREPLRIQRNAPYTEVEVEGATGLFLLDFASNGSSIDPTRLTEDRSSESRTLDEHHPFASFGFFGPWGEVSLQVTDSSHLSEDMEQAGIIGTDFLSRNVFTVDYEARSVHRATEEDFCNAQTLHNAGFTEILTSGRYTSEPPLEGRPNVAIAIVEVFGQRVEAHLDTGLSDDRSPLAVYINTAFRDALLAVGAPMEREPSADHTLSTCVTGVSESVEAFRASGEVLNWISPEGESVRTFSDLQIFVKSAPLEAHACGGIGTSSEPEAQLGGSFFMDFGAIVFNPFDGSIWVRTVE